jgi:DNA-binding ferritin-like protein (Dps family)
MVDAMSGSAIATLASAAAKPRTELYGGLTQPGTGAMAMYDDLADLLERCAADGTPIRDIFGEDPVEFVEAFVANYPVGQWRSRERSRFTSAIARAAAEDTAREDRNN